jgi:hypothetical protein
MTFLGSDHAVAREKIIQAKEDQTLTVSLSKGVNGYAKLTFSLNQYDTWDNMGWALDQLNIDVDDKDVKEGSFYINVARTEDKGIWSRMFGDDAIKKIFPKSWSDKHQIMRQKSISMIFLKKMSRQPLTLVMNS